MSGVLGVHDHATLTPQWRQRPYGWRTKPGLTPAASRASERPSNVALLRLPCRGLGRAAFLRAMTAQDAFEPVVAFVAGVFVDLALAAARRQFHRPGTRERRRIVDGHLIEQNIRRGACE